MWTGKDVLKHFIPKVSFIINNFVVNFEMYLCIFLLYIKILIHV